MEIQFRCKEKPVKDINESGPQDYIVNWNTTMELHKN